MSSLNKFYNKLKELPEDINVNNKYLFLVKNKIIDGKYLHASEVMNLKNEKIKDFMFNVESSLIFPISVDNYITSLFFKSISIESNPLKVNKTEIPYGFDYFNKDFKYGDSIILVEGIADLGALKLLNPKLNVIAMLSNSLSKGSCEFITKLTNNFIVITDNDKAGDIGFNTIRKRLRPHTVNRVSNYGTLKNPGEILEILMKYQKTKDTYLKNELYIIKSYYLNNIKEIAK